LLPFLNELELCVIALYVPRKLALPV